MVRCVCLLVVYCISKSIEPIGKWIWFDLLTIWGNVLMEYGVYILVSIPLAWLAGGYVDKVIFSDSDKMVKEVL